VGDHLGKVEVKHISWRQLLAVTMALTMTALFAGQASAAPQAAATPALWAPHCTAYGQFPISPDPYLIQAPTGDVFQLSAPSFFDKGTSCDIGKSSLRMQTDGNFVLYDENNHFQWATNTVGRGEFVEFQPDGNLVVWNADNQPVWGSLTCCHAHYFLAVQADGNVVIYDTGWIARWSTRTNH
jgi:hypothetical protein